MDLKFSNRIKYGDLSSSKFNLRAFHWSARPERLEPEQNLLNLFIYSGFGMLVSPRAYGRSYPLATFDSLCQKIFKIKFV